MFGRGYVIEHCISSFQKYHEEKAFRIYVTDLLRALARQDKIPRYYDLIKIDKAPQKSAKEVKEKIRGKFK